FPLLWASLLPAHRPHPVPEVPVGASPPALVPLPIAAPPPLERTSLPVFPPGLVDRWPGFRPGWQIPLPSLQPPPCPESPLLRESLFSCSFSFNSPFLVLNCEQKKNTLLGAYSFDVSVSGSLRPKFNTFRNISSSIRRFVSSGSHSNL